MPSRKIQQAQIAASGPSRFGGILFEEFLPELRFPMGIKVYEEMRKNSGVIGGFLRAIETAFRSTRWKAIPYSDKPEDRMRAEFLNQVLDDMDRSWADVLSDILTFLPFGFSAMEMVFKVRAGRNAKPSSRYNDNKIGFRDLVLIPHASIMEWIYDPKEPNELVGIKQLPIGIPSTSSGPIEIPIEKVLLFRIRAEKDSPEGESVLRQAYRSWWFMNSLEVVEAISLERTGAGIPVVSLPQGATTEQEAPGQSDEEAARQVVRKIRVDDQAGVVEPYGWQFRLETSKGLRPEIFDLAIKRHRANILISVLATFLELGTARVGSFATAKVGRSHFENALEGWVMTVEETFNSKAVPLLFELNGYVGELPRLSHTTLSGESLDSVINAIIELTKMQYLEPSPIIREYLQDLLRLPRRSVNGSQIEPGASSSEARAL